MSKNNDCPKWKKDSLEAFNRFKNTITEYRESIDYHGLITYLDIDKIPLADSTPLKGKNGVDIFSPKLHRDDHHNVFLTVLNPNEEFEDQWHNCIESVYVISGILSDRKDPSIRVSTGQSITYSINKDHEPCNLSKTEPLKMVVTFFNPKKVHTKQVSYHED